MGLLALLWDMARVLLLSALILGVLEVIFRIYYKFVNQSSEFNITDGTLLDKKFSDPDSYAKSNWYVQYKEEAVKIFSNFKWSPYVYWVAEKFEGTHITVGKYHLRRTLSFNCGNAYKPLAKIWFFGGSTIWGWGARDNFTIPSCYAALNNSADNDSVSIENHGQLGYVSTQEMLSLIKCLRQGKVPDHVIFYDGLNDVFSSYQQFIAGIPQNEVNRKTAFEERVTITALLKDKSQLIKFFSSKARVSAVSTNPLAKSKMKSLARSVVSNYFANIRIISALAAEYGFKVDFFWQPTLFDKNIRTSFEEELFQMSIFWKFFYDEINRLISQTKSLPGNFNNLTQLFCDYAQAIYIDPWHTNEDGNARIAKAIYCAVNNKNKDLSSEAFPFNALRL